MNVMEVAEKRINDGINKIFTQEDYPPFLSFASNFLNFSYKNIILIYLQDPKAQYVAGINAWKKLTGLGLRKNSIPIMVLYPVLENSELKYEIQKVFDFRNIDNDNIKELDFKEKDFRCDKDSLFENLKTYLEKDDFSIYPDEDIKDKAVIDNEDGIKIIRYGETMSEEDKFSQVLDLYIKNETKGYEPIVSGTILGSCLYMIYSYYGLNTSRIKFTYLAIAIPEEKKKLILEKSFLISKSIIENINGYQLEKQKMKPDVER